MLVQLRLNAMCEKPSCFTKYSFAFLTIFFCLSLANTRPIHCQVIAAAQTGKHNDKRESFGETLIIDPWGTIIGRLPGENSLQITFH